MIPPAISSRCTRIRDLLRCLIYRLRGKRFFRVSYPNQALAQALAGASSRTDISDHLGALFYLALDAPPGLMVELGTRGGESTRALLAATEARQGELLSIDITPCEPSELPHRNRWTFVQADDVAFARNSFPAWCLERNLEPRASFIFLDTSHELEHTRAELASWVPFLAKGGTMVLHDTNMGNGLYVRYDGSVGVGWDNERGVIRAIEELLGRRYEENTTFVDRADGFLIWHIPYCNGLTVLKRLPDARH